MERRSAAPDRRTDHTAYEETRPEYALPFAKISTGQFLPHPCKRPQNWSTIIRHAPARRRQHVADRSLTKKRTSFPEPTPDPSYRQPGAPVSMARPPPATDVPSHRRPQSPAPGPGNAKGLILFNPALTRPNLPDFSRKPSRKNIARRDKSDEIRLITPFDVTELFRKKRNTWRAFARRAGTKNARNSPSHARPKRQFFL